MDVRRFVPHFLIIFVLVFAACTGTGGGGSSDPLANAIAQATAGARALTDAEFSQASTRTAATANAQSTQNAISGTAVVETAQASATAAVGTAQAIGTADAQSTAVANIQIDQDIRERDLELEAKEAGIEATAAILDAKVEDFERNLEQIAENTEIEQAAFATRAYYENLAAAEEVKNKRTWRTLWIGTFIIFAIVALIYAYTRFWRDKPVQNANVNGVNLPVLRGRDGGYTVMPGLHQLFPDLFRYDGTVQSALPSHAGQRANVPHWHLFVQFKDPVRIPVGADYNTLAGVFLDKSRYPHLFWGGSTGAGKTRTGIIPYTTAMLGAGAGAILINGGGADFNGFESHPNTIVIPRVEMDEQGAAEKATAEFLNKLLIACYEERNRRNGVLKRYNAGDWFRLPDHAGESGEIVIIIDEFIEIVKQLEMLKGLYGRDKKEERDYLDRLIRSLWYHLKVLTSTGRKYGIFFGVAATDPTSDSLGEGWEVVKQMARFIYRIESAATARSILSIEKGSDYPQGTKGFDWGHFLTNIGGDLQHGVGFQPDENQLQQYFGARQTPIVRWPDKLAWVEDAPIIIEGNRQQDLIPDSAPPPYVGNGTVTDPEVHGRRLSNVIDQLPSQNAVARFLLGEQDPSYKPAGQYLESVVRPALRWRTNSLGCNKSRQLLNRTRS